MALAVVTGAVGGIGKPSLSLAGGAVSAGDAVVAHVSGATPGRRLRLYLRQYPSSTASRVAIGALVPDIRGRAQLTFRLPDVTAAVYRAVACCNRGAPITGHGLLSVRALPPMDFGPLGAPGCAPASPRNRGGTAGFTQFEVFGTAVGAQLWALVPGGTSSSGDGTATMDGVVGKQTKIVFRMTSGVPLPGNLYSVAPDGTRVPPVWGPDPHTGSSWDRPGSEWGAGFDFAQTGCWRIHAGSAPASGDIWLSIRS